MANRYVRVQTLLGTVHYGLLAPNHEVQLLDAAPWLAGNLTGQVLSRQDYRLLPPCLPSKLVAVGKNYADHAAEMGTPVPAEPLLFLKPPSTVIAAEQTILLPRQSSQVEYEGELAIVIGETSRDCSPEMAQAKIWGYTIANDVTARDLQRQDAQWTRAKGFDTFCPLGPWIVQELSPSAQLQTFINDEPTPRQLATIEQMTFPPDILVSYISQIMTLLPGDVILTGTPAGVGPLQTGDQVRVEIEGIGWLSNRVLAR
jgi:2-keto-4-pentenoate hydratase/2-oxohepta-3-ene-1,7-dioic acid hydratase in catechol pathway